MFEPPMRPVDIDQVPIGPDWVIERKHDGWRALAHILDGEPCLVTRTGHPITQVPYILTRLAELVPSGTILDGELVNLAGGPELDRTRSILKRTRNSFQHKPTAQDPPLTFAVFDILALGGEDLRDRELAERKRILASVLGELEPGEQLVSLIDHQPASETALQAILTAGYEGAVVKHLRSRYLCGVEGGGAWFKIKRELESEAVLTGFYTADPDSKYARNANGESKPWAVGGLCFTVTHPDGREVDGRAAGMDDTLRSEMHEQPDQFIGLVVEIAHRGVEASGALRNPVFKRLRDPEEKPRRTPAPTRAASKPASKRRAAAAGKGRALGGKPRMRNYGAMGPDNLLASVHSLRNKSGEAYERCLRSGSGDPDADLVVAEKWAREKGLL